MKQKLTGILCLILALIMTLPSCTPALVAEEQKESKTEESVSVKTDEKEPAPKTEENKKTEEKQIMQKTDPKEDDTINLLMIGNSFCYFYVEELYEIAKAAGVKMRVCNLYYSGCSLEQHWEWWKGGDSNYDFYTTDEKGRRGKKNMSLQVALKQENWDFISLQQASPKPNKLNLETQLSMASSYAKDIFNYLKEQFPMSKLYWHETWAYEVGYDRSNGQIPDVATQTLQYEINRDLSSTITQANGVDMVPSGDAWQIARQNPVIGDKLCTGTDKNDGAGDHYHDGNTGGGQYLNACVWFEVLTGKSCIGNTWKPSYDLSQEKISALQQAAHSAVAAIYGENYAK